ncbi:MAG: hypothetical protein Kow0090_09950 [Myxococcota bacterium]
MAKRKGNKPKNLTEILTDSFKKMGLREKLRRDKAVNAWRDVVGAEVAAVSRPILVKNRVLFVAVDSPSWINELNYYSEVIVRQINRIAEAEIIEKIRWQNVGEIRETLKKEGVKEEEIAQSLEPTELPPDLPLAKKIEAIEDEEFKKALKKLVELSYAARKRGEPDAAKPEDEQENKEGN